MDLSALIRGLLVVISIAVGLGQYPKLERWSREQAAEALEWKRGLPHFFAGTRLHQTHLGTLSKENGVLNENSK